MMLMHWPDGIELMVMVMAVTSYKTTGTRCDVGIPLHAICDFLMIMMS